MVVLLVNLLIAMMGDTYTKIAEIKNEWMRQVCKNCIIAKCKVNCKVCIIGSTPIMRRCAHIDATTTFSGLVRC